MANKEKEIFTIGGLPRNCEVYEIFAADGYFEQSGYGDRGGDPGGLRGSGSEPDGSRMPADVQPNGVLHPSGGDWPDDQAPRLPDLSGGSA